MDKEEYLIIEYKRADDPEKFKLGLALRLAVFIDEQKFAFETEEDDKEYISDHFILVSKANPSFVLATIRTYEEPGRVATRKEWRGKGLQTRLFEHIIQRYSETKYTEMILHSQLQAIGLYQRFGFVREGGEFDEDGAPHVQMKRVLPKPKKI